jgi:hypothetical protein
LQRRVMFGWFARGLSTARSQPEESSMMVEVANNVHKFFGSGNFLSWNCRRFNTAISVDTAFETVAMDMPAGVRF